jgi:NAD-dependent histone deacetylase SIR2
MGNQASTPIDESIPPETLESRTIEAVAKYVQEGRAKNIVVLVSCFSFYHLGFV